MAFVPVELVRMPRTPIVIPTLVEFTGKVDSVKSLYLLLSFFVLALMAISVRRAIVPRTLGRP